MTLAYIGRLAPPGREGAYMGGFTVAQVTGFGLGPLLGGGIRDAFNSETAFATMGIMLAGTALLTLLWLPPKPGFASLDGVEEPSLPWSQIVRRRAVQGAVLFMTLMSLGWGAAYSFIAIFVTSEEGLGLDSALFVGILLSLRQLTNAALQPITGRLADRVDRVKLVSIGLVLMAVGTGLIPLVPDTTIEVGPVPLAVFLLLTVVISGVGESLAMPAQQAVFVTLGRVVGMGSLMGLNNMGMSAGFLFGSLAGAGVVAAFGVRAVFLFAAAVMFLGMFLYVAIMRSARRELEHAAEVARLAEEREKRREAEQSRGDHGQVEAAV
jgi:MFS family permease